MAKSLWWDNETPNLWWEVPTVLRIAWVTWVVGALTAMTVKKLLPRWVSIVPLRLGLMISRKTLDVTPR